MDSNEYSSIFWKVQYSHSRHQKTTSNFLRIHLKGRLEVSKEWSLEGAMYKPMVKILGSILTTFFVVANFSKYWWFQTKQFTRLLEFIKLCKQNPCRHFFFSSLCLFAKTILWFLDADVTQQTLLLKSFPKKIRFMNKKLWEMLASFQAKAWIQALAIYFEVIFQALLCTWFPSSLILTYNSGSDVEIV